MLDAHRGNFGRINAWGPDLGGRLLDFALRGKMVRGGLLLLGHEMHAAGGGRAAPRPVLRAAAAMEIIHSSLLIHDDIMDNDRLRRGGRTIFAQYEQAGRRARAVDPAAFGRSMGICAGDVGYFLAWEILSGLAVDAERKVELLALVSRELSYVGLAQMQDVAFSAFPRIPSRDDVLALYIYKTARYTFALPLMAGALIAGAPAAERRRLCELGERLGVIFQVRDDELGIFGSEAETGKPVGSDIREGKKTLLYLELIRRRARGGEAAAGRAVRETGSHRVGVQARPRGHRGPGRPGHAGEADGGARERGPEDHPFPADCGGSRKDTERDLRAEHGAQALKVDYWTPRSYP